MSDKGGDILRSLASILARVQGLEAPENGAPVDISAEVGNAQEALCALRAENARLRAALEAAPTHKCYDHCTLAVEHEEWVDTARKALNG